MKARLWSVLLLVATCAMAGAASAHTTYPLTVRDDGGATVVLQQAPQRILSLTLPSDEILLALVDKARIVGVTSYAADPLVSNVATMLTPGMKLMTLNPEAVLGLRPDLVIVANWSDAASVKQLRDAGLTVYLLAAGLSVPSIEEKIRALGTLTDTAARATDLVARMDARLAAVSAKVAGIPAEKRVRVMDYATWGSSQGRGSSWDEIITRAGAIDAVGDKTADQWGQVPLSKENILQISPDILILPGWVDGDPKGATAFFTQITSDPGLQTLAAVRNKRVSMMPEYLKSTTSQYIVDAVEWLARTAYPSLF